VSELDALDGGMDALLRREGTAWRATRRSCPHPDLLMARKSEVIDGDVRAAIRTHLEACEACRRLAADLDGLGLEQPDMETEQRVRERVAAPAGRRVPAWIPAAAVVALGVSAALWWTRSSSHTVEEPPATVARVPPAPSTRPKPVALWEVQAPAIRLPITGIGASRSGAGRASDTALADALEGYRTGRLADSIAPLERLAETQPDSPGVNFYLGVAYLLSNRAPDAVGPLERARPIAEAGRRAEIDWYLATAEQRAGRIDAARTRLRALCEAPGEYRDRACAAQSLLR
jgi:hypothetical protein